MKNLKNSILCLVILLVITAGILPVSAQNDGWKTDSSNIVGGKTYYSVNFVTNEESWTAFVESSSGLPLPEDPYREGYRFVRWDCEGNTAVNGMAVTHDLTLTAVFEPIIVANTEISYVYSLNGSEVVFGSHRATLTPEDVKNGPYTVISPEYTEVNGVKFWPDRQSVSITAEDLNAAAADGNSLNFSVTYMPADVSYTLILMLETPDGTGWEEMERSVLNGRMGNEAAAPDETEYGTLIRVENSDLVQAGQTVTAYYNRRIVSLTFNTDGGKALAGPELLYGQSVNLDAYKSQRDGYEFKGWLDEEGSPVSGTIVLTANRTLTAKWEAVDSNYSVVYYKEMFSGEEMKYEYAETEQKSAETGTRVSAGDLPLSKSYTGYEPDEAMNANSSAVISGDGRAELPVYYRLKTYTFTFDTDADDAVIKINGQELNTYSFEARLGEPIASKWPADTARPGWYFSGWDNYVTKRITVTEDMLSDTNYTAQWTQADAQKTINYYLQDPEGHYVRSEELSQTVYTDQDLNAKTLTGFTNNTANSGCQNDVCNFYYDRIKYQFEYYDGGKLDHSSDPIPFGADVSSGYAAAPESSDRSFVGWYADSGLTADYQFTTMPNHNVALYARWKDPQVTFDSGNGTETRDVTYGQAVSAPADPVKAFHTFTGWFTAPESGDRWNFSAPVTEDMTLYAHFTPDPLSYTVRYLAETGAALHAEKTVTASGAETGDTVSEQAVIIAGWLAEKSESSLVLNEDPSENVLTFRYQKAPQTISYTVFYLRADDNTPVHEPVTRTVSGDTAIAYEFAAKIEGLFPTRNVESIALTAGTNELTFYYREYKTGSLTVRMLDMDGDPLPGQEEMTRDLRLAEGFDGRVEISGYTWDHAAGMEVFTVTEDNIGKTAEMELYYRKNLTLTPADLTKTYDGEPLMNRGTGDVLTDGLAEGHSIANVVFSGSQTEVGSSPSHIESVMISGPKAGNAYYDITFGEGTLTVTEKVLLRSVRKLSGASLRGTSATQPAAMGDFSLIMEEDYIRSEDSDGTVTIKDQDTGNTIATYKDGVLTIHSGKVTLSNKNTTSHRVVIAGDAEVTLDGVNIEATDGPAIKLNKDAKCILTLAEGSENVIAGATNYAGIEVGYEYDYKSSKEKKTSYADLTINGSGKLEAFGKGNGAAIGGTYAGGGNYANVYYGNITIESGTIIAKTEGNGAGIGSSANVRYKDVLGRDLSASYKSPSEGYMSWGTILIKGGDITAIGGKNGSGIGGGNHVDSGIIIIDGGTIHAQGETGIGTGQGSHRVENGAADLCYDKDLCKGPGYYFADITINGGEITATSGNRDPQTGVGDGCGAGIGGGSYADAKITITGGIIDAAGGTWNKFNHGGAGIGGGYLGHATIDISGGNITATGAASAAGIGSGGTPNSNTDRLSSGRYAGRLGETTLNQTSVTISNGNVEAHGGIFGAAGIGGGVGADKVSINISGGNILAFGAKSCNPDDDDCNGMAGGAGIGSGIDGISLAAIGSANNDNISGTESKYFILTDLDIKITNGNVIAVGGWGASAIGSGAEYAGIGITDYKSNYTDEHTKINISADANIVAYADGTKFAIDTRLLQEDNTTLSKKQEIAGNVLQGTFVHAYHINNDEKDFQENPEGLSTIKIFDAEAGELVKFFDITKGDKGEWKDEITGMKDFALANYRSFAVTVPKAGQYLIYTDVDEIGADGTKGRYFACSTYDKYYFESDPSLDNKIRYTVKTGELSDNFYLYPVKTIIIHKSVKGPENMQGVDQDAPFSLKVRKLDGSDEPYAKDTIRIRDGKAQNDLVFENIPDNRYQITEDLNEGPSKTFILKEINGPSSEGGATENVSFENVYEIPATPTPAPPDVTDEPEPPEETPTPVIVTPTVTETPVPTLTLVPTKEPEHTPQRTPEPRTIEPVPDNPPDPEDPELVFVAPQFFIDEYGVPLGLGQINLNAADCFE